MSETDIKRDRKSRSESRSGRAIGALLGGLLKLARAPALAAFALSGCTMSGYAQLPAAQQADVKRVETYLDSLKSLQADFAQTGPVPGQQGDGTFVYVPGALRMDYEVPQARVLVARDGQLVLDDKRSGAVTHLSLTRNPLGFLLRTPLRFDDGVQVSDVRHGVDSLQISLTQAANPSQGLLTLQFSDVAGKLALAGLQGVDARDHRFGVSLFNLRANAPVSPSLFKFPGQ